MGVQEHQFLDRKDNSSGLRRDGMRSGGYSLCCWIAPGVQILHPEALPALHQQQAPEGFGEKVLGLGGSCCRGTDCSAF